MTRTVAIVNPRSANGRTARTFNELQLGIETLYTDAPGHATQLTANALREGADTIIAVGGDGTISEVVNGFFDNDRPIASMARLAIIPCGTGSDFRRSLKIPLDPHKAAELLHTGMPRQIDVMRVRYTTLDGQLKTRYSVNVTSFGLGGAVAARANRRSKALGGRVSFLMATIATAARFAGRTVSLRIDDKPEFEARITNVVAGNGQFHGGGMWMCPGAILDDGLMDITVIGELSPLALLQGLPAMYNGRILSHPKVRSFRARRIHADSSETSPIEIDGEPLGKLPAEITILPKVLWVISPESL